MKYLVTGVAGFIGSNVTKRLLDEGHDVVGLDNLNDYYDVSLKKHRMSSLYDYTNFFFEELDLCEISSVLALFKKHKFDIVIHLAAQAGVRYSLENPLAYTESNITGFLGILEGARYNDIKHLVYASSSSVYGMNPKVPFSTGDAVDHPVSLYAATKKSNELMAHTYSHLYGIPTTGLRFFTVYGPAGRPDMAPWLFTNAILKGEPIKVFNHGKMERDFTYIDDIVEGIIRLQLVVPQKDENNDLSSPASSTAPYRIYNIGNNNTVRLGDFIEAIESACGKEAEKVFLPMQKGDVVRTFADIESLESVTGYKPKVQIQEGVQNFVNWFRAYHNL